MKLIKIILVGMVGVGVMVGAFYCLEKESEESIKMCVKSGHDIEYCEAHIAQ